MLGAACAGTVEHARERPDDSAAPVRGGTLEIVSFSDVDHLSPTSAYTGFSLWLNQLTARQLLAYPPSPDNAVKIRPAPDVALQVPTKENGGLSVDGTIYTLHLRHGVRWNSPVPRNVVAGDFVRAFKLICNPVLPASPSIFFTPLIAGMTRYCADFAKVPPAIAAIRDFVNTKSLDGVQAVNDSTIVFRLVAPSSDFVNLLAMGTSSAQPVEYLDYLPDGPAFRQHTVSDGPYQLAQYAQNREMTFERNPVWDTGTDPIRPAYVDRIHVRNGIDAQLQQLQIEAGTADLSAESVRGSDIAPLLASKDPNMWFTPSGDIWGLYTFLAINRVSPDADRMLGNTSLRRALSLATDKAALVQVNAGRRAAQALRQAVPNSIVGFVDSGDRDVTPLDRGDPEAARRILREAGFKQARPLRLAYPIESTSPVMAQVLQASYKRAGIDVELLSATYGEFYGRLLGDFAHAKKGEWDLAMVTWYPDWYGANNGRAIFPTLFDGRNLGSSTSNYGGFQNPAVDRAIDRASAAPTVDAAALGWQAVARLLMDEVASIPLVVKKVAYMHSSRVRNCTWSVVGTNCDLTALWLADATARPP
jgi:ABC-type transport system substrate-binding protein